MAKDTIGIDVSKDRLDAFWHSRSEARRLPNTEEGFGQLCDWLGEEEGVLIVFEATGAYHRGLERHLSRAGRPFIKVNPKQSKAIQGDLKQNRALQGNSSQCEAIQGNSR